MATRGSKRVKESKKRWAGRNCVLSPVSVLELRNTLHAMRLTLSKPHLKSAPHEEQRFRLRLGLKAQNPPDELIGEDGIYPSRGDQQSKLRVGIPRDIRRGRFGVFR